MHVLIPSYNCGEWIERSVDSVISQSVQAKQILLIDDASDRSHSDIAFNVAVEKGCHYIRNTTNMKCPYNLWMGFRFLDPKENDVVFLLDGDDFLPHQNVLRRISEVYSDPDVWLTYGNYEPHPYNTGQTPARPYPDDAILNRTFRTAGNYFNHPITFRAFLFDALTREDLQNKGGAWFRGGYDFAIMAPMLEMCGSRHYRFLDENLYSYNAENPISDSRVNMNLIRETDELMHRQKKDLLIR